MSITKISVALFFTVSLTKSTKCKVEKHKLHERQEKKLATCPLPFIADDKEKVCSFG